MSEGRAKERIHRLRDASLRRLKESERAVEHQFNEARLFASLAVGLCLVGFLLVAQWRGNQTWTGRAEGRSEHELAAIIQDMALGNEGMRSEVLRLETRSTRAETDKAGRADLLVKAREEVQTLRVLSGAAAAEGAGVRVVLSDSQGLLLAQDLVALANELRAAGAEALCVSDTRLTARSGFSDSAAGVRLDGQDIGRTVEVLAIGDPDAMLAALAPASRLVSTLQAYPGVRFTIGEQASIQVPAGTIRPYTRGVYDD